MNILPYLSPIFFLGIGYLIGSYISKLKNGTHDQTEMVQQLKSDLEQSRIENKEIRQEKETLSNTRIQLESELHFLREKQAEKNAEIEQLQEKFTKEFENLANKILEDKSRKFTVQNKENIDEILKPLQTKIQDFEKKVEDSQKENIGIHAALKQQLETLSAQNQNISEEAKNLTKALKGDSKAQGNWGELVLERVLEVSGLEKGREYDVQQSFRDAEGNLQLPDVIVHLPDGKKMIVDSKVSLTHYERYINSNDDEEGKKHLKEHLNSLKRHITQLAEKKYEDLYQIETPDFVLLFVPVETAFSSAINEDPSIYPMAFEQKIVIVTPSTLLASLRTIVTMWTTEKQRKNTLEIARQAGALYDKFEGLLQDLIQIGKKIDDSKEFYEGAMNKLSKGHGSLIGRVQKLKDMGAKAKKSLPEAVLKRVDQEES